MFSSISKYSPKKLLATYLSKSLAEFFCVDPERVETNLMKDAKVVLKDIQLQEQQLHQQYQTRGGGGGGIVVHGMVQRVEFSWEWDASLVITNVSLTIQGVSIHIHISNDGIPTTTTTTSTTTREGKQNGNNLMNDKDDKESKDWKAKYLQQIIDHLTLIITDVKITIHVDDDNDDNDNNKALQQLVVVQGKDIELRTLTTTATTKTTETITSLLQTVQFGSIESWIEERKNNNNNNSNNNKTEKSIQYPILEPFGYTATVQRVSGRRFLDGVMSGLFVQGEESSSTKESSSSSSKIRLHAGIPQIAGLNRLQQLLLSLGEGSKGSNSSGSGRPTTTTTTIHSEEANDPKESNDVTIPWEKLKSIFHLPLQSVEVILENTTTNNNTVLGLVGCTIRYCTDGSELLVDCNEGIWFNDSCLSKNNRWVLDFVNSELVMDELLEEEDNNESHEQQPFRLELSVDIVQQFYSKIQTILPVCEEAMTTVEQTMKTNVPSTKKTSSTSSLSSSSSKPWTIKSNRDVTFCFTDKSDTWVQLSASVPTFIQGINDVSSSSFDCASIVLESNAGFSIDIPRICNHKKGLAVQDGVTVCIESLDTIKVLQNMWNQVNNIFDSKTPSSITVPFDLSIPKLTVSFDKDGLGNVNFSGIEITGNNCKLNTVEVIDMKGLTTQVHHADLTLDDVDKLSLTVGQITKLSIDGIGSLSKPLDVVTATLKEDLATIKCNSVLFWCPSTDFSSNGDNFEVSPSFKVPFSVHLDMKRIMLMPEFGPGKPGICFDGLHMELSLLNEGIVIESTCNYFQGREEDQSSTAMKGIGLKMYKSLNNNKEEWDSLYGVRDATLTVSEVSSLNVPGLLILSQPAASLTIKFHQTNGLHVDCPIICVRGQELDLLSSEAKKKPANFDLPCKVKLSINSFQYNKQVTPPQVMECKNIDLSLEPVLARIGASESSGAGVYFAGKALKVAEGSTVFDVPSLSASGLIQFDALDRIGNLLVEIDKARLEADFSSMNWSGSMQKESSKKVMLPFVAIPKFDLELQVAGKLLQIEGAVIACDKLEGNANTSLDDITAHYIDAVKERIPYLLSKADIAGSNVGDNVGMMAGKILLNKSVVGATVGVAVRDAVGSTLTQGKAARGVSSEEKYKFGDFSRGLIASTKNAAKSGTEMRGGENYEFGDFTAGTVNAAGSYASENRVRLAGATGASVGMIAGAALLGPVGFVAGSFLGSSAAQSSMRAVTGDPKEKGKQTAEPAASRTSTNVPDNSVMQALSPPVPTSVNAELVGEVASANHRAVMVQAQVVEPLVPAQARNQNISNPLQSQQAMIFDPLSPAIDTNVVPSASAVSRNLSGMANYESAALHVPGERTSVSIAQPDTSSRAVNQAQQQYTPNPIRNQTNQTSQTASEQQDGYRFGDITRGIVARGRQRDGRDPNSGYKFGDFTRGLFG